MLLAIPFPWAFKQNHFVWQKSFVVRARNVLERPEYVDHPATNFITIEIIVMKVTQCTHTRTYT